MPLFTAADRHFAQAVADLSHCNPFLPERIELERAALGDEFEETSAVWSKHGDWQRERQNVIRLNERTDRLVAHLRERLVRGDKASASEFNLYEDLVNYLLYQRYRQPLAEAITESLRAPGKSRPGSMLEAIPDRIPAFPDNSLPSSARQRQCGSPPCLLLPSAPGVCSHFRFHRWRLAPGGPAAGSRVAVAVHS